LSPSQSPTSIEVTAAEEMKRFTLQTDIPCHLSNDAAWTSASRMAEANNFL